MATCVCGARARPGGRRSLMRGRRPSAHLDALNALGDDVGVVHGHQRDLDAGHPSHGARPQSCKQSAGSSALPASGGVPASWALGTPAPPKQARFREQSGWPSGGRRNAFAPAQLTTQGVRMQPNSVSTAATRRTPKSSVRTRIPVTGQFSMTWE